MKVCPRCGSNCGDGEGFCAICGYAFPAGSGAQRPNDPGGAIVSHTSPFAVASLVLGIASPVLLCCYGFGVLPSVLAIVFGVMARSRIRQSAGGETGMGLATAGIVLGIVTAALFVLAVLGIVLSLAPLSYLHRITGPFGSGMNL